MESGEPANEHATCAHCDDLTSGLVNAVLALGRAGQPVEALRIAATAYAAIRRDHPSAARRLNNVMHTLAAYDSSRPSVPPPETRAAGNSSHPEVNRSA